MASAWNGRLTLVFAGILLLSACEEGADFRLFGDSPSDNIADDVFAGRIEATVEQDVEFPEVFGVTDSGLWDGRPSLGGVWIAHPDVAEPERVIIRNTDNGKFIIGALFHRERENPGPKFQVSSDAATELGMLAGAPSNLSVVALRRVEVPVVTELAELPEPTEIVAVEAVVVEAVEATLPVVEIDLAPLDSVIAIAASAIEAATAQTPAASLPAPATAAETALDATAVVTPIARPQTPPSSALAKPFVQIGIFSIHENAEDTAALLRSSGIIPTIKTHDTDGTTYWRIIVGPIGNTADRAAIIRKARSIGFADAYAVAN